MQSEREIVSPVAVCDARGALDPAAVGFARRPIIAGNVPLSSWGRRKRWDYWCVFTDDWALAVLPASLDVVGLVSVSFLDVGAERFIEHADIRPLARGIEMPFSVGDRFAYRSDRLEVLIEPSSQGTRLFARAKAHGSRPAIEADVMAHEPPGHESLNVVVPFGGGRFQLNGKHGARPASGTVVVGGTSIAVGEGASACLDWGRGVWPSSTHWRWAHAATHRSDGQVAFNAGGLWTDGSGSTENGLIVCNRLHKISDELSWSFDPARPREPWRISAPSGRVDVTVRPRCLLSRGAYGGGVGGRLLQVWGRHQGVVRDDEGREIEIDGPGWAEQVDVRW